MTEYSIRVLEFARAPECPAFVLAYGALGSRALPYSVTVLQSREHTILVDTGYDDSGYGHTLAEIDGIDRWTAPLDVLATIGVAAKDVDTILLTHAHYDHLGNIERFPNAVAYLQRRELERWTWALGLPPKLDWLKDGVDADDLRAARELVRSGRLRLIDGRVSNVLPGIHLDTDFDTHTFGHQHIIVEDQGSGSWVLPGDAVYCYDNLGGLDRSGRYVPIGYGTGSPEHSLFAIDGILEDADGDPRHVVPGHEFEVFRQFPSIERPDRMFSAEVVIRRDDETRLR
jgi:glyoxylase-like metal-dependent hydrolase (beta-lactamase superfamily II)